MSFRPANLHNICYKRKAKSKRVSSYDITGGNDDRLTIPPGESRTFAEIDGAGLITHIWITMGNFGYPGGSEPYNARKVFLSFYWDGEENPSVLAPIGDFFGMGHGETKNFVAEPLQMSPQNGRAFNCWFPMPFGNGAKMCVTNECTFPLTFYFYVDYEEHKSVPDDALRFHAQWRRECPTDGIHPNEAGTMHQWSLHGENTTGDGNYVILDAEGEGHYVGCNINIHNLSQNEFWDWPGEGDDMIFIDGEPWPPRLHGTGTEDYVNTAWCPQQEYSAPYHGIILGGGHNWKGKITYYRYHIRDPIMFEKSIKVTMEHGHNNHRSDDWSTTAYWYQAEPHKPQPPMPKVEARLPLDALGFGVRVFPPEPADDKNDK